MGSCKPAVHGHYVNSVRSKGLPTCVIENHLYEVQTSVAQLA